MLVLTGAGDHQDGPGDDDHRGRCHYSCSRPPGRLRLHHHGESRKDYWRNIFETVNCKLLNSSRFYLELHNILDLPRPGKDSRYNFPSRFRRDGTESIGTSVHKEQGLYPVPCDDVRLTVKSRDRIAEAAVNVILVAITLDLVHFLKRSQNLEHVIIFLAVTMVF